MLEFGDSVLIVPSEALIECQLMELEGRTGMVMEVKADNHIKNRGAWVSLDGEPHLGEYEWFIPLKSLKKQK